MIYEKAFKLPVCQDASNLLAYFEREVSRHLEEEERVIRFVVTRSDLDFHYCEVGIMKGGEKYLSNQGDRSIFSFEKRKIAPRDQFNVVLIVPTGIGAEIGGHAGDAGPVAKLLANTCDYLITHPNVVNASDINELPANGMYTEGSTLCRLLMGTIGLRRVRSNRVLLIVDNHPEGEEIVNESINSLNAARAVYGLDCPLIVKLDPPLEMSLIHTESGRASGVLKDVGSLLAALENYQQDFDAIAITTGIQSVPGLIEEYYRDGGRMMNPWGGSEALLTHAISLMSNLPSAHSPMCEIERMTLQKKVTETIEPCLAAEWISSSFLQCILKGLQNSPQIITDPSARLMSGVVTANDISCLVIPDHCLGLPVLAALEQGIKVIAVRGNKNLMKNDLESLPWKAGQFYQVDNYLEAAGLISALKAGVAPESLSRPFGKAMVVTQTDLVALSRE